MTSIRSVRASEGKFVQIANAALQDRRLSFSARGVLAFVLSLPPDAHLTAEWLEQQGPTGREAVRSALAELAERGYYRRTRSRGPKGHWVWEQIVTDATTFAQPTDTEDESSQVSPYDGNPSDGNPSDGNPSDGIPSDKELTRTSNTSLKDEPTKDQKMVSSPRSASGRARRETKGPASRQAHGSAASVRILTDEDKISGTRFAIAAVYGEAENQMISDEDALALYESKRPADGKVRSVTAYMTKIFDDTPDLDTHLAGLDYDGSDDYDSAAEQAARATREQIINGDYDSQPFPPCSRCGGMRYAIGANQICAGCEAEIWSKPAEPEGWNVSLLQATRTALYITTGKTMDDAWCARVVDHILHDDKGNARDIRGGVQAKVKYITTTISSDPNPARFLPTPQPSGWAA